uniref:Uncharacterized protein n=1 Tax=Romanomermis culicivorax TaxID=13658 RepID=A0A915K4X0_ROMCU
MSPYLKRLPFSQMGIVRQPISHAVPGQKPVASLQAFFSWQWQFREQS